MSATALRRRRRQQRLPGLFARESCESADRKSRARRGELDIRGALTLDDLIAGAWERLSVGETASCPACDGAMAPRVGESDGAPEGDCPDCGTRLA
jgi:DnaJ-class molecular chaperone